MSFFISGLDKIINRKVCIHIHIYIYIYSTDGIWCNIHVLLAPVSSLIEKATGFIIFGQLALVITINYINYALPHNHTRTLVIIIVWVRIQKLMISSDWFHDFSLS